MVAKFGEKFVLIQVPVFIVVSLFDKLQDIVIADVYVQVLVENALDIVKSDQSSLLSIKKSKQIERFLFPSTTEKPFLCDHFHNFA